MELSELIDGLLNAFILLPLTAGNKRINDENQNDQQRPNDQRDNGGNESEELSYRIFSRL